MTPPRFSLIVPAYNEVELLPRLLASVEVAARRLPEGAGAVEVIVADNASTDGTAASAERLGARAVRVEKRSIGAARNGGAALARGEVLLFTDADGQIHRETFNVVARALASPRIAGGSTGVTLERWSAGILATYALLLPLVWTTGFDTGVVFCRRADFAAVGGFPEDRPYGEDVAFQIALWRHARAGGRRLVRVRGAKTLASPRKFDEHGDWHYFTRMGPLAWRMIFRKSALSDWAERYWYRPDR